MPRPPRRLASSTDQPALPLDLGVAAPAPPRAPRVRPRPREEAPAQLTLEMALEQGGKGEQHELGVAEPAAEPLEFEAEPPDFDPDPFAEIPGFVPPPAAQELVLLPGSLRSRLDMREFTRFLASLPSVARDWEGAPEMDDGGIRLHGPEGGAWIYPEPNRVRLVTDNTLTAAVGEDLVALCRWLESRAGMQLYSAGEATGTGADRSLDPWDTFLGR